MKTSIRILAAMIIALLWSSAGAVVLNKESKVTVTVGNDLSVDMYADINQASNYYYVPSRVRVAAGRDNRPKITILTYISDGSGGASGGTFNALVTWGFTEAEERQLQQRLTQKKSGARLMGAAPVETVREGPSVNVLVALGGDEEVAWSGTAPLSAGGRAAIAANLTPTGASLLDAGIKDGNLAGITVEMNFLLPFQADMGRCDVTIDWSSFRRDVERLDYSQRKGGQGWFQDSWKFQSENEFLASVARQNGHVTNNCSYNRANQEQIDFFEKAVETFLASALGATQEARDAADEAAEKSQDQEDEDDDSINGGDWDRFYYNYVKRIVTIKSGTETFTMTRSIVVRDPVPAVIGNVKEWVTGNENSPGVRIASVNLTTTEFNQVPVAFSLGENAIEMFGNDQAKGALNNVAVSIRKRRSGGNDYRDFFVFTKKEILDGTISHQFEYARGSATEPFEYEYSLKWSFVGQQPRGTAFVRSESGSQTIEPSASAASIIFNGNTSALNQNDILGVAAEIKHKFLGKERTTYMNVFANGEPTASTKVFVDNNVPTIAYRTVFTHARHGELATPWAVKSVPAGGAVAIYAIVPEEISAEDPSFLSKATDAVAKEANKKLDDVLSEFDKL